MEAALSHRTFGGADIVPRPFVGVWGAHRIEGCVFAAQGSRRREYSDASLVGLNAGVFAVADGVSSAPGGARAARFVAEELHRSMLLSETALSESELESVLCRVNGRVFAQRRMSKAGAPMGASTVAGILFDQLPGGALFFSVGDSSVWRLSEGALEQASPIGWVEDAKGKRLLGAIGAKPTLEPWVAYEVIGPEGAALIATDGFGDVTPFAEDPWFARGEGGPRDAFVGIGQPDRSDDATLIALRWRLER